MIKKFISSELGKGTIVLFITINIYNFLNFFFHFAMGRMLGPVDYGTLAVLMSIVYIFGAPAEAIQNIISKYTSKFSVKKEYGKTKFLFKKSLTKALKWSFILFIILIIPSYFLSIFLNIEFSLILITNLMLFVFLTVPIARGTLQGGKKLSQLGIGMIIEAIIKLLVAIILVILGFKVFGAIIGVLIGVGFGFIALVYFNKNIIKAKEKKVQFKKMYSYSIPYFVSMIVILLVLSIDIILAKRFFSPKLSGEYAVLSMLGKIIFFGTIAISKAMFPLTSEKHYNKEHSGGLFKKSVIIVISLCSISIFSYFLFPKLIISLLYGRQYLEVAPYLVYSAIAMSFLSLSNLILIYGLSINKIKKSYYLFLFLIIEIILLFLFHNTLKEYIFAVMISNIILFIGSFLIIKSKK